MPMSSLSRVLFLLHFLQTDGLQTDGSRLFRHLERPELQNAESPTDLGNLPFLDRH